MATQYEFLLRFRNHQEPEGQGSLLYKIVATATVAASTARKIRDELMQQDPSVQFDGMTLCACQD